MLDINGDFVEFFHHERVLDVDACNKFGRITSDYEVIGFPTLTCRYNQLLLPIALKLPLELDLSFGLCPDGEVN